MMMHHRHFLQALFLLAVLGAAIQGVHFDPKFTAWMSAHNKTYTRNYLQQEAESTFLANQQLVANHDRHHQPSFALALNQFADQPLSDFRKYRTGLQVPSQVVRNYVSHRPQSNGGGLRRPASQNAKPPASVDWRQRGAVTPIKDQGACAASWAFSATGAIEGACALANHRLVDLSEQQLLDCASNHFNCYGCKGGHMNGAFAYVIDRQRMDATADYWYPYSGTEHYFCWRIANREMRAKALDFVDVRQGDEEALRAAVAQRPVAVAISAGRESFQLYKGGVYAVDGCGAAEAGLDHGMLCVGYGRDEVSGLDYWLLKNSWGAGWGEAGYMRLARGKGNMCGVASMASYVVC